MDELLGTSVDQLLPQAARGAHADRRTEYSDHPRTRADGNRPRAPRARRSGDEFPVEISLSPLHTDNGLLIVVIVRDVDRRDAPPTRSCNASARNWRSSTIANASRVISTTPSSSDCSPSGSPCRARSTRAAGNPIADRIQLAVDDIDVTIRDIRSSIFALHTRRPFGESLRDDVLLVAREAARVLGFEPTVAFDGPLDSVVTDEVRANVIATLREALSNATKHAHASSASIELVVEAGEIVLQVRDDGIGVDNPEVGNGLRNMHERAAALGGTCSVDLGLARARDVRRMAGIRERSHPRLRHDPSSSDRAREHHVDAARRTRRTRAACAVIRTIAASRWRGASASSTADRDAGDRRGGG